MLLLLLSVPAGVFAGWVGRGSLLRLLAVRWRGGTWIVAAFALRAAMAFLVPERVLAGPRAAIWSFTGYLLTYGSLFAVAAANRRLPGAVVFALGAASNLLAIAGSGGRMPYWTRAASRAFGRAAATVPPQLGHAPVAHLVGLRYLADIFPLPGPLASVFSVGDALIALGAFWLVFRLMTAPETVGGRPRPAGTG